MKTSKQMVTEIEAARSAYITYGEGEIGTPVKKEEAIADILAMDDEMIGDGTWYECDEVGNIIE